MKSLKEELTPEEELFRQLFSDNPALDVEMPSLDTEQNSVLPYVSTQQQHFMQPTQVTEYRTQIYNESNASTTSSAMSFGSAIPPINSQIYLPSPLMLLNLSGPSGNPLFRVKVPRVCGKNKWTFSTKLYKLYAGRNVCFPMKVFFPPGRNLSVVVCPVFENTNLRLCPVRRCINCSLSDTSPLKEHLLRVAGTDCHYLLDNDRTVIEVPLRNQSMDETAMTILFRMTCRTSCLGGPNRQLFALLFTLLDENRQQIASDVQHVKCCESPFRDLKNELKHKEQEAANAQQRVLSSEEQIQNTEQIATIASSLATKQPTKRKVNVKYEQDCVPMMIPKKYEKKVRKYVNLLYCRDKVGKSGKYFSSTDTE